MDIPADIVQRAETLWNSIDSFASATTRHHQPGMPPIAKNIQDEANIEKSIIAGLLADDKQGLGTLRNEYAKMLQARLVRQEDKGLAYFEWLADDFIQAAKLAITPGPRR